MKLDLGYLLNSKWDNYKKVDKNREKAMNFVHFIDKTIDNKVWQNPEYLALFGQIKELENSRTWNREDCYLFKGEDFIGYDEDGCEETYEYFDEEKYKNYCDLVRLIESGKYNKEDIKKLNVEVDELEKQLGSMNGLSKIFNFSNVKGIKGQIDLRRKEISEKENYYNSVVATRELELENQSITEKINGLKEQLSELKDKITKETIFELFEKEDLMMQCKFTDGDYLSKNIIEEINREQSRRIKELAKSGDEQENSYPEM